MKIEIEFNERERELIDVARQVFLAIRKLKLYLNNKSPDEKYMLLEEALDLLKDAYQNVKEEIAYTILLRKLDSKLEQV